MRLFRGDPLSQPFAKGGEWVRRVDIPEWQASTVAVIRRGHIFWGQGRQGSV